MLFSRSRGAVKNESIEHLWLQIETLWRNTRPTDVTQDSAAIDDLISKRQPHRWRSEADDWALVNEVEQRIGSLLSDEQLFTQYRELLQTARDRQLASLVIHEKNAHDYFSQPPTTSVTPHQHKINRDIYLFLLSDLQGYFVQSRFERRLRREAASSLTRAGVAILLTSAVVLGLGYFMMSWSADASDAPWARVLSDIASLDLLIVMVCGAVGAYFSRLMRFQAMALTLGFAEFQANFISQMMAIRVMTGVFGALVLYYLMRSGLVGGEAFPLFSTPASDMPNQSTAETGISTIPESLGAFSTNKDMAKLIVWSFLAGFSERMVPDALGKSRNQSNPEV